MVSALYACKSRADIAFLIDSSSTNEASFEKEKQFIKNVVRTFEISDTGVHISLVSLNSNVSKPVQFIETQTASDFLRLIDDLKFFGKSKRIDEALRVAYNGLVSPNHDVKADTPQVLVILTDGIHVEHGSKQESLSHAVLPFHEAGIKIVVAGVLSTSKVKDFDNIVKSPNDLILVDDLDSLVTNRVTNQVAAAACQPGKVLFLATTIPHVLKSNSEYQTAKL